jgi:hypothetical protein
LYNSFIRYLPPAFADASLITLSAQYPLAKDSHGHNWNSNVDAAGLPNLNVTASTRWETIVQRPTYPAKRAMAQKPTTAKVNQMMPKRFSFRVETNE